MWLPSKAYNLFEVAKETVSSLREDLAVVRAERDLLKLQLAASQNHFDWLRIRVNSLETERAQLLKRAYNIDIPVPELVRVPSTLPEISPAIFDDIGDTNALNLGLPVYSN